MKNELTMYFPTVKLKWVDIKPWCYLIFFFESPPSSSWTQKTFSFWSVNCARAHTFLYSAAQWATAILNLVHTIISVRLWNFKYGGSLKASCLAKNQRATKKKIFRKFLKVMTVCQKLPKLYFQSQFWLSKINRFFFKKKSI